MRRTKSSRRSKRNWPNTTSARSNYGVVGIPKDEDGARKVFEFAKNSPVCGDDRVGGRHDTIEKLVKEYDIRVASTTIPGNRTTRITRCGPNYILSLVKDRDQRIGSCADTGHWVRSGLKPVDCLRISKDASSAVISKI